MSLPQKLRDTRTFVEESWVELQRVTWPDYEQLRSATLVVIIFCIIVSFIILAMDKASSVVLDMIMGIFGA